MSFYDPVTYGARANGKSVDTLAIQKAIDDAYSHGGGTVVFPAGKSFVSGSLVIKSNVFLHVEQGALLKCSTEWSDLTETWPGGPQPPTHYGQIYARTFLSAHRGTSNIGISGPGTIDGAGEHYRGKDLGTRIETIEERPFLLFWVGVQGVTLKDVTLRESAFWTVRLSGCEDVLIHGIRIRGNLRMPNCDGIDLDRCRKARISDCDIICADDAISIKGCREFEDLGNCEDIVVTNCTMVTKSSALVIGCDASCPLRNITFSNCIVRDSNRGLSVNLSEEADYSNILFSNIVLNTRVWSTEWWGRGEPIYLSATPWHDKLGTIRNIRFTNILARSECGAYLAADSLGQATGIVLDNVKIELGRFSGSSHPEEQPGQYDRRPTSGERQVYTPDEGVAGFHLENLRGVRLRECEVEWVGKEEKWMGNALWSRGCEGLEVDVRGEPGKKGLQALDVA